MATPSAAPADAVVSLAIPSPLPTPPPHIATALLPSQSPTPIPSRRLVTPCWSHDETLALLDAYRDKWFALRRGNLRANDWQDVAADVALRCPSSPPKTPVQCRHKIEKLRKRFRTERQKSLLPADPSAYRRPISASSWAYFAKMEAMERGEEYASPVVTAAIPPPNNNPNNLRHGSPFVAQYLPPRPPSSSEEEEDEDEDNCDESDGIDLEKYNHSVFNNSRGPQNMMPNGGHAAAPMMPKLNSLPDFNDSMRYGVPKSVRERIPSPNMGGGNFYRGYGGEMKEEMEDMRRRVVDKRERRKEREEPSVMGELASALRVLGDGFLRMEYRKMEMAREMEKMRMEMELKRTEMILDSQRRLVDAFVNGLFRRKKAKISPEE